ncbi:MAG TPA: DegT/DnrJ/EryC1/StrS family aminotransferase [Candidatus Binatia bacterium]|nr:DegT/DnrJ/EryC1/StrS family aminotransferase [Candidatus Binatia bacterium]
MKVPFLDLRAQDAALGAELRAAIDGVLGSGQFILGPTLERFEAAMAEYAGVAHAIGVGSGTDALLIALHGLGVGPGRAVVTTPFTFFSTASTVLRLGGRVVFADIAPDTFNIDPVAVEEAIAGARDVIGILPVHLFGRLAPMNDLAALAARHGLWLLEDAAQAIGARADGRSAGTFGRAGVLSFYPTKNLGALGDGGMILTGDDTLAAHARRERHQGQTAAYVHASLGVCSRLDALQAAALHVKLVRLEAWNARRREIAGWYGALLAEARLTGDGNAPLVAPGPAGAAHVFHQYVLRARDRDRLRTHLDAAGIATMVYYPAPLHLQPALAGLGLRAGAFPEAERAAREVVALPIYPELLRAQVETVVEAIAGFYRG